MTKSKTKKRVIICALIYMKLHDSNGIRTHNQLVRKRQSKTKECRFTLKFLRDMITDRK